MFQQMQQTFEVGVNAMKNDYHISEASYLREIQDLKMLIQSLESKVDSLSKSLETQSVLTQNYVDDERSTDPIAMAKEVCCCCGPTFLSLND